jgi:hypothetical protein
MATKHRTRPSIATTIAAKYYAGLNALAEIDELPLAREMDAASKTYVSVR